MLRLGVSSCEEQVTAVSPHVPLGLRRRRAASVGRAANRYCVSTTVDGAGGEQLGGRLLPTGRLKGSWLHRWGSGLVADGG